MCEQFVARAVEPFRIDELWPFTERLERYGVAGFGWGAGWLDPAGTLESYRNLRAFRDDPGRGEIGARTTTALLVHLRRPSKLSTIDLPDTQPFDDPAGRYVLAHNGDFDRHFRLRARYRAAGRIHGRADSEVGARWVEDAWQDDERVPDLLASLHEALGGQANLAVLTANGGAYHYAGNRENPVFSFRLGRIGIAATGLYSLDRSLFRFAAAGATDRRLVAPGSTVALESDRADVTAVRASP